MNYLLKIMKFIKNKIHQTKPSHTAYLLLLSLTILVTQFTNNLAICCSKTIKLGKTSHS